MMDDCISRQAAIRIAEQGQIQGYPWQFEQLVQLPSIQPEIIYCKDCKKHNMKVGFDKNGHTLWKEDACPLCSWRGKAGGHEFDYQYCVYGERRTDKK